MTTPTFRRPRSVLLLALLICGAWLATTALPVSAKAYRYLNPIFPNVTVTNNLIYGHAKLSDGKTEPLRLDLFQPTGDTARNRPVLIFIHGGGQKDVRALKHNRDVAVGFAVRGWVSASIDMRSGTSGAQVEGQHDIRAAVRWFRANAAALHIAPSRIVLFGSSAGGIGALGVNFAPEDAGNSGHPGYSSAVAAAIAVGSFASRPDTIGFNETPILMFHAADDRLVPIQTAKATCTQTRTQGNVCVFYQYDHGGHPPPLINNNRAQMTYRSALFICKYVMPGVCHGIG